MRFDATSAGTTGALSHTCNVSNGILFVDELDLNTVVGMTYNGITMTKLAETLIEGGSGLTLRRWYLLNPPNGTHSISAGGVVKLATSYSGVTQSGVPDSFNVNASTPAANPLTNATTVVDPACWLLGVMGATGIGQQAFWQYTTPGVGRNVATDTNFYIIAGDSAAIVATGSQTVTFTNIGSPGAFDKVGSIVTSIKTGSEGNALFFAGD